MTRRVRGLGAYRPQRRYIGIMNTRLNGDGSYIMNKWPRPAGKAKSINLIFVQQFGRWLFKSTVLACDQDAAASRRWSAGTMYLPRDILMMAMTGTWLEIVDTDGQRWWSSRQVATEVQAMLDQITQTPGALIVRGATDWIAIVPQAGDDGKVLTSRGPGQIPFFATPGGGGGASFGELWAPPSFAPSRSSGAVGGKSYTGVPTYVTETATISTLSVYMISGSGFTGDAAIYDASETTHGILTGASLLASTNAHQPLVNNAVNTFTFDSQVTLAPGKQYYVGVVIYESGTVHWASCSGDRNGSYFTLSGTDLPDPAPSSSTARNDTSSWWVTP